ncbi:tom complex component, partial [Moniliophthora roreri]
GRGTYGPFCAPRGILDWTWTAEDGGLSGIFRSRGSDFFFFAWSRRLVTTHCFASTTTTTIMPSEDTKERIAKVVDVARTVMHYGWIPFIIYVGFTRSNPQPSLIKLISPLA